MKVRIYKPAKSAMQSGRAGAGAWVLDFVTVSSRRPEPLMGWTASADTLNQVRMTFGTAEEAVAFAQSKGWEHAITGEHGRKVTPRNYGDNFRYIPPEE